jgi:hypothetical protein
MNSMFVDVRQLYRTWKGLCTTHILLIYYQYTSNIFVIFEGCASAAGPPLRSRTAQQIGGPADCCSVEAVEDSSFVARLACKGSLVGCVVGWAVGWLVGLLVGWLVG